MTSLSYSQNTSSINISGYKTDPLANNGRNSSSVALFSKGDVISAFFTEKSNGEATLVMKNGFSFKVDESKIKGEPGDELKFNVEKFDKSGILLKQLGAFTSDGQIEASISEQTAKELFEKSGFTKEINVLDKKYLEEQAKAAEALARVKRQISYATSNMSSNAVAELVAAGMSLQKIDISMLTETIREVKTNTPDKVTGIEQKLGGLKNGAIMKLLKDDQPLTAENIYVAKHSAAEPNDSNKLTQDAWEQLGAEVNRLFEREGIENSEHTDRLWKMMIQNDVPITKENIQKALFLLDLDKNIDKLNAIDVAENADLFEAFKALETGAATNRADISQKAKELLELLGKAGNEHVDSLINLGHGLSFANLKALFGDGEFSSVSDDVAIDSVTARRQLAELQLMMTEEAAKRLYAKNLDIDTMPVRRVIEELKVIEAERYSALLRAAGARENTENVSKMENLYTMIRESQPLTNNVFARIVANNFSDFDISAIHETVMSARTMQALSDLETFQTVPNPKYADSFSKVYSQLAPFVEDLGLEASNRNVRAAAILSKNEMDVTINNILTVKEIDFKITDVYNRLHPSIAANMIKDGLNPASMHIDDVVEYIDEFNDKYGWDLAEKIPDYIAQMDKDKSLSSDEREAMIAVYRMLNQVQKNGSAAIGVAVKNGIDMTLGNMLEASKFFRMIQGKSNKLDISVDEQLGGLEKLEYKEGSIYGAFAKTESPQTDNYHNMISKQFAENLDPVALKNLLLNTDNALDMPFDELNELLSEIKSENSTAAQSENVRRTNENLNITTETVKYMVDNNIPLTLANMGIVQNILKNPYYIADRLDELENSEQKGLILDSMPDFLPDTLANGEEEILGGISTALGKAWDASENPETLNKINTIQSSIKLQTFMPKDNELNFKLPISFGGKITGLNMYILNSNAAFEDHISFLVSLKTANLGEVGITVSMEGDSVKAAVIAETQTAINHLLKEKEVLSTFIEDAGLTLSELKFRLKGHGEIPQSSTPALPGLISGSSKYEIIV